MIYCWKKVVKWVIVMANEEKGFQKGRINYYPGHMAKTKRELKEEVGIDVELTEPEPRYVLEGENGNQYFSLVEKVGGIIGTGKGPEFTDPEYKNRGKYSAEMISIQDIVSGKINMVPQVIKEKFIADFAGKKRNGMRDVDDKGDR